MTGYLIGLLNSTKYPLWVVLLWGCVVLAGSIAHQYLILDRAAELNRVAEGERRLGSQLHNVKLHVVDFQIYAESFVSSVMNGESNIETRKDALKKNLIAQDATVDILPEKIGRAVREARDTYREKINEMTDVLDQIRDAVSLSVFWKAASDLLVSRDAFLKEFERHQLDR